MKQARQIKMSRFGTSRVLVIGELNVDIVATGLRRKPQLGTEIVASDFDLTLGSASAIFASGVAKLGHPVTFISQVGQDLFGDFCLRELELAGVSTENVARKRSLRTGITIALSGTRDRALITYPGAIATLSYEQLPLVLMKGHQHLHMTSYFLQQGLRPAFPQIFQQARAMGLTTSFDPNWDPNGSWSKSINRVLRHTNVLFVNKREALQFTRSRSVNAALKRLGQLVPCAVIKQGSRGAAAIQGNELVAAAGFTVETVDTTGAGDSFDAGFISAYLRDASLSECLRLGNACGALSTRKLGGTAGQPNQKQIRTFLRRNENSNDAATR